MSFSSDVRNELSMQMGLRRHCQVAELGAILAMCGGVMVSAADHVSLRIVTENRYVTGKAERLIRRLYHLQPQIRVRKTTAGKWIYICAFPSQEEALQILTDTCMRPMGEEVLCAGERMQEAVGRMLGRSCCRRAYLRGAFLAAGSISDPKKFYHFEIACQEMGQADQLKELMGSFGLDARIVQRKRQFVVYIKEGAQIVDALGVMEATNALLELENIRILREISGSVNRQVNCETANLNKTVSAAVKQIEDIRYIQEQQAFSKLPAHLQEMALARLANPEMGLKDLGRELDPPIGKSGVNHRLKHLSEIAQRLREQGLDTRKQTS